MQICVSVNFSWWRQMRRALAFLKHLIHMCVNCWRRCSPDWLEHKYKNDLKSCSSLFYGGKFLVRNLIFFIFNVKLFTCAKVDYLLVILFLKSTEPHLNHIISFSIHKIVKIEIFRWTFVIRYFVKHSRALLIRHLAPFAHIRQTHLGINAEPKYFLFF